MKPYLVTDEQKKWAEFWDASKRTIEVRGVVTEDPCVGIGELCRFIGMDNVVVAAKEGCTLQDLYVLSEAALAKTKELGIFTEGLFVMICLDGLALNFWKENGETEPIELLGDYPKDGTKAAKALHSMFQQREGDVEALNDLIHVALQTIQMQWYPVRPEVWP